LCAITRLPLKRLLIASYVATNILGVLLMYFSGREYVFSTKNKVKAAFSLAVNTALLSALVYFLDKSGMLAPLPVYFSKWFRHS
jgi:hypothetical protein